MPHLERYGPVTALRQGRRLFFGWVPPLLEVRCYAVDGLLIDCGLACLAEPVLAFARDQGATRAVVTHHHEDHSGNAVRLRAEGLPVLASRATRARMRRGFSVRFYQRVAWGRAPTGELDALPAALETPRHRFDVHPAPGHCEDQVVLHEPDEGWLFSGDAFLAERVKLFRGDEDFAGTVASLERLLELDFDALYCAHRPVLQGGKAALARKLERLRELEERVRSLHQKGWSLRRITREVLGPEPLAMVLLSQGDLSKRNLVRSILFGPTPRGDEPSPQELAAEDAA